MLLPVDIFRVEVTSNPDRVQETDKGNGTTRPYSVHHSDSLEKHASCGEQCKEQDTLTGGRMSTPETAGQAPTVNILV